MLALLVVALLLGTVYMSYTLAKHHVNHGYNNLFSIVIILPLLCLWFFCALTIVEQIKSM